MKCPLAPCSACDEWHKPVPRCDGPWVLRDIDADDEPEPEPLPDPPHEPGIREVIEAACLIAGLLGVSALVAIFYG
jgi:hypothetical protein